MKTLPALFVGHGAPDLAIYDSPAHHFLKSLGQTLPKPKSILAVSAHWETSTPYVSAVRHPETIYDFRGFDPRLRDIVYAPPGAPDLARRLSELIPELSVDSKRGLDHGAWVPLHLLYPTADIPVTQLSVMPQAGPEAHYALGKKLRPLKEEGVLILATGGIVHNLAQVGPEGSPTPEWAQSFDGWISKKIAAGDLDALFNFSNHEYGTVSHPTAEHLMPLFVAMGAGMDGIKGTHLHQSFSYGSISMASYSFD